VLAEMKIAPGDMDLMILTDDPAEAAQAVMSAYHAQTRVAVKRASSEIPA